MPSWFQIVYRGVIKTLRIQFLQCNYLVLLTLKYTPHIFSSKTTPFMSFAAGFISAMVLGHVVGTLNYNKWAKRASNLDQKMDILERQTTKLLLLTASNLKATGQNVADPEIPAREAGVSDPTKENCAAGEFIYNVV